MDCKKGFSTTELSVIIFLIGLFFVAGAIFLEITSKSAYDITARHDLEFFAEYQQFYYKINGRCIGEQGQSIRNDGLDSDLVIDSYTLSDGVSITIISGDPENPHDLYNPYTFQGRHVKSDTVFGYNFRTKTITER